MPCRYEETEAERQDRNNKRWEVLVATKDRALNALTHDNDRLREQIIRLLDGGVLSSDEILGIRNAQQAHRMEDLKRLRKTFADDNDWERLRKVLNADPSQPLESQLGFDPDEF